MRKVLKVGRPYIETDVYERVVRLCAKLYVDNEEVYTMWYKVDEAYGKYFCPERSDAFVVSLLLYAMEHEFDIESEQKMSERLHYQLMEYLIPCIANNISKYKAITINAETTSEKMTNDGAVGASISGGVDSFYTLLRHLEREEKMYNITHLTFFNVGASGDYGGEEARKKYESRILWIEDVVDQVGKNLICVDSNVSEFLMQRHVATHTFRTLAIPLALQKLFSKYYFSSGYDFSKFMYTEKGTAQYDLLSVQCLSTDCLTFYSSGGETTRLGKIKYISNFPITYQYLNVCGSEATNCSRCEKCERTMLELYSIDKLDNYKTVFDVDYFYKHKRKYLSDVIVNRNCHDWLEIFQTLKVQRVITWGDYAYAAFKMLNMQMRKIIAKKAKIHALYKKLSKK